MSTLKRLLNVGKGKARVATRGLGESLGPADGDDDRPGLLDEARHAAADAAEAFAEAVRPPERRRDPPSGDLPSGDPEPSGPEPAAEPEPDEAPSPPRSSPRKRSL